MSISSEITRLQNAKASIKTSIENKGVTVPSATKLDGYSTLIDSIPTGITPTGTISITSNGTVDVTNYASADVSVAVNYDPIIDASISGTLNTNVTNVPQYALYGRGNITKINAPFLKTVKNQGLARLNGIANMAFPLLESVEANGLRDCSNLEKLDVLGGTGMLFNNATFYADAKLNFIVIRRTAGVCTLGHTGAFNGTCFASGGTGGTLYVPNALISSYQSATNWSTILGYTNNQIKSIESTHTDPTAPIDLTLYYADGTPIS